MKWLWLVLLLAVLVVPAAATVFRSGSTVTIPAGQVIDDDLVVSGNEVRMNGRVTGDLVAAGGDVRVTGPVGGNLIVAGGNVRVSGPVGGSLYAASGDVELNAPVARNVVAAAGTLVLGEGANVGRDVTVNAGDLTVNSTIGRHLRANAGTLALAEGAVVGGDVIAKAGSHKIAPGAHIQGKNRITRAERGRWAFAPFGWFMWQLFTGIALLIAGLLFITLAPKLTEETETVLRAKPWVSLAAGLLILLVGLPLFLLLLATLVGIPVALIWAAVYFTAVYISPIFLAILVGRLIWRRPGGSLYLALLIGIGLLFLVRLIPFFGGLVTLAAVLFGLGALSIALFNRAQPRRPVTEPPPLAA